MKIRQATLQDAQAIAHVHVASWQAGYKGLIADSYLQSLSISERTSRWQELLQELDRNQHVLVAEEDHDVCAFCHFRKQDSPEELRGMWYELHAIYALPSVWGRGVGSELLKASLSMQEEVMGCYLWALEGNQRAHDFYTRHGFIEDLLRKQYRIGEELHYIQRFLKRTGTSST